jgi:hypothetical protein
MKLRSYTTKSVSRRQRERLQAWLHEWDVHRNIRARVREVNEAPESGARVMAHLDLPVSPLSAEPKPAVGQIRLISPGVSGAYDRQVLVAVLWETSENLFMCAPFGIFAEPAVPGELLVMPDVPSLRVLCVWNARELGTETVGRSWLIDTLSRGDIRDANLVFRHYAQGDVLPAAVQKRVGPPLIHPLDPRRDYLEEEAWRFLELAQKGSGENVFDLRDGNARGRDLRLAAESPPPAYGKQKPRKSRRREPRKRRD